jgi:predicted Zn-dependent peptidase
MGSAELAAGVDAVTLDDLRRVGERALAGSSARVVLGPKAALAATGAFAEALNN